MRRFAVIIVFVIFLCGCSQNDSGTDRALALRSKVLNGESSFLATVTADYGEYICVFKLACNCNSSGEVSFQVQSPETVKGISGVISETGGDIRFDDRLLTFPLVVEDVISPVSGPWVMMQALRGGYIRSTGDDGEKLQVIIDDSYYGKNLQVNIWLDSADAPIFAEIIWQGSRVLSVQVENYTIV